MYTVSGKSAVGTSVVLLISSGIVCRLLPYFQVRPIFHLEGWGRFDHLIIGGLKSINSSNYFWNVIFGEIFLEYS